MSILWGFLCWIGLHHWQRYHNTRGFIILTCKRDNCGAVRIVEKAL